MSMRREDRGWEVKVDAHRQRVIRELPQLLAAMSGQLELEGRYVKAEYAMMASERIKELERALLRMNEESEELAAQLNRMIAKRRCSDVGC